MRTYDLIARYLRKDDVLAAQMSYDMVKLKTMRRIAR